MVHVRTPARQRLVVMLFPLILGLLAVGLAFAMTMPFLSLFLSTEVHAGPARVTLFLVLAPLSGVVASIVMGRLSDRGPVRRRLMIIASLTGVVGCSASAVVRDYWILLGLAVTAIALAGTVFPQTLAYARQWLIRDAPDQAAMGTSTLRTVVSAAWVGGPPLAAFLVEAGGFRVVYGIAAALYAVAALVVIFRLDEVEVPAPGPEEAPLPASSRGTLWWTAAAFVLLQAPLTLGAQAMPFLTAEKLGGDVGDAGLVLGLCAALEIPLILSLGLLSTRFPLRPMVLGGAVCGVLYYAVATAANGLGMLFAAQLLNALFIAAVSGLGISYVQDMLPQFPGRATTLFTNTFPIGAMLAGPLFGMAQRFDIRLAYGTSAALCLVGLAILLAVRNDHAAQPA
ncbi:sugar efflux transporter [Jidongwangia harbinensis]|uniref:sugar efflux transporter n=1 Tax=Jidongwangia harbinensis TaxID=2878561 RepID=UPI001CD97F30|nr:sugar efflux transporter [Jidongwangia harbinensis]MCA2216641.1 sugar efflux transporter [Jidongwangia harbinensis]